MPGGVLFGSSSIPVHLFSTFCYSYVYCIRSHYCRQRTYFLLYFYCRREDYGCHFSGDSTGHPSGFCSGDKWTFFSYYRYMLTPTAAHSSPCSNDRWSDGINKYNFLLLFSTLLGLSDYSINCLQSFMLCPGFCNCSGFTLVTSWLTTAIPNFTVRLLIPFGN